MRRKAWHRANGRASIRCSCMEQQDRAKRICSTRSEEPLPPNILTRQSFICRPKSSCMNLLRQCAPMKRWRSRRGCAARKCRSEEHTSELQSLMRISYAVFCLQKKKTIEEKSRDYE